MSIRAETSCSAGAGVWSLVHAQEDSHMKTKPVDVI